MGWFLPNFKYDFNDLYKGFFLEKNGSNAIDFYFILSQMIWNFHISIKIVLLAQLCWSEITCGDQEFDMGLNWCPIVVWKEPLEFL
jgi:hypothetical protein